MSLLRSNHQLGRSFARCLSSSSRCATHPTKPLDPAIDAAHSPISSHPHPAPVAPSPSPSSPAPATPYTSPFDSHAPPTASTSQAGQYPHSQAPPSPSTHFGFKDVPEQLKESLVKGVFSSVASSYDVMNDAMSLGIHRLWKDHYVSKMDPRDGMRCLDVAGGTGDIAMRLLDHARTKYADRDVHVQILDINPEMLDEGRKRFAKSMYHGGPQVSFTLGNAEELSTIPDNSIDLYTIAFGIRNCTHIDRVLEQAHRVLKPGGVFSCLEFSKVSNPLLAKAYQLYSFQVIPTLGHVIASDRDSYQYLVESIERFPPQARFSKMIEEAGFTIPRREPWEDLTFGIAAIHTGVKL
ncbi:BQ5605_C016g08102 [Microbotryum silenes-dioicae]|uniref:2-methoxy-6-polyprenyl-1,4-benzoquinol methylase, mitochondrial n=1 Tax=Microbotryum silenes-dioicae TaxID=796604 RepID=A0A2X0LZX7_9BASI|nr:BQ5605_C016g08102 [Microbotryum silenes-dioicae]